MSDWVHPTGHVTPEQVVAGYDPPPWAYSLTWRSVQPQPGADPDPRQPWPNPFGVDEDVLGPEWGTPVPFGDDRVVDPVDVEGLAAQDFVWSAEWQPWLLRHVAGAVELVVSVEDRSDDRFELRPDGRRCTYRIGVGRFDTGRARDVYRRIERDLYVHLARRLGWPDPPARLPPYFELPGVGPPPD